jgi:SAM-dependent methyltransferase
MANAAPEFDAHATDYERELERGVRLSGESSKFFARQRVEWLRQRILQLGVASGTLLDFGCGNGSTTPLLLGLPGAQHVIGTDVSGELLDVARREHGSRRATFIDLDQPPAGRIDVAYCNGVFHHIRAGERAGSVAYVHEALRPGGLFAMWENNPWNPGTRMVMSRIPFDRDAEPLTAWKARRLLLDGGFSVIGTDFLFIFPHALRAFRGLERRLVRLPLGAQYVVLARRR